MQYKQQSRMCCLAYALWQVGAVSEVAVKEYEQTEAFKSWDRVKDWFDKYVPELSNSYFSSLCSHIPGAIKHNLEGKGLIILANPSNKATHAISYEDGLVLDSALTEKRLSLEDYLLRYPYFEVLKVMPISQS